jgi:hypothetical protein
LKDEKRKLSLAVVASDRSVHVLDKAGSRVCSTPLAYDPETYRLDVWRLEEPQRYLVWYRPWWYLGLEVHETMPAHLVEYNAAGQEIARRTLPPRPQLTRYFLPPVPEAEPSYRQAWFGLVTPPAEAAVLVGTTRYLLSDLRSNQGREVWLLLQFLASTTTYFIPGAGWNVPVDGGLGILIIASVQRVCWKLSHTQRIVPFTGRP